MQVAEDACYEIYHIVILYVLVQVRLRTEILSTPKFDLTTVQNHDLQIMTVHCMSLRRLL